MIGVLDYGLGNVNAIINLYNRLSIPVKSIRNSSELDCVNRLILPGVGSFDRAIEKFEESGLKPAVEKLALIRRVPILGICVGMQILADKSEEGQLAGLGWIPGHVKLFTPLSVKKLPVPHMGWNDVLPKSNSPLFDGFHKRNCRFYFLHSYYYQTSTGNSIASANFEIDFTCAVNYKNIYGVQFHPEKSHHYGEQLLKNFAEL